MKHPLNLRAFSAVILASVLLTGCGPSEKPATSTSPAAPATGVKTFQITGDDTMKYNVSVLEAKAGEPLRVVLTNVGKLPKQAMAHNWLLLKPCSEADFNAFGMAAATAAPTHIPPGKESQILAQTKLLGPGESETINFRAPDQPGEYPFLCTFPGHYAIMRGKLVVK